MIFASGGHVFASCARSKVEMKPGAGGRGGLRRLIMCAAMALGAVVVATASAAPQSSSTARASIPPPPPPYQPGDRVWYGEAPPVVLSPLGTGCQRVPATGYLAPGASDRTTGEYSNHWSWSAGSAGQAFSWWVYTTGGTLEASGSSSGGGSTNVPPTSTTGKSKTTAPATKPGPPAGAGEDEMKLVGPGGGPWLKGAILSSRNVQWIGLSRKLASALLAAVLAAAVIAVGAYGSTIVYTYTAESQTFASDQGYPSPNDNCYGYWNRRITDNVHNHPSGKLGRSAIIAIDGSWLKSTADTNPATWAQLNGTYQDTVKKGYSKNISGSSYTGNGRVYTENSNFTCV
jgi:hypothetical protein